MKKTSKYRIEILIYKVCIYPFNNFFFSGSVNNGQGKSVYFAWSVLFRSRVLFAWSEKFVMRMVCVLFI